MTNETTRVIPIDEIAVGKIVRLRSRGRFMLAGRRPTERSWQIFLSWPMEESNSDDPGSMLCRCDFAGQAHRHATRDYTDPTEARRDYDVARERLLREQPHVVARTMGLR